MFIALTATDMKKERKRNLLPVKLSIHGTILILFNLILLTLCLEVKVIMTMFKIPGDFFDAASGKGLL